MIGTNGLSFCRWVKERWPALPVILVSGYTTDEIRKTAGYDGIADHFLSKPWQDSQFPCGW